MSTPVTGKSGKPPNLTVQQLKALCKERKISGYSKLTKSALIQKLEEYDNKLTYIAAVPKNQHVEAPSTVSMIPRSSASEYLEPQSNVHSEQESTTSETISKASDPVSIYQNVPDAPAAIAEAPVQSEVPSRDLISPDGPPLPSVSTVTVISSLSILAAKQSQFVIGTSEAMPNAQKRKLPPTCLSKNVHRVPSKKQKSSNLLLNSVPGPSLRQPELHNSSRCAITSESQETAPNVEKFAPFQILSSSSLALTYDPRSDSGLHPSLLKASKSTLTSKRFKPILLNKPNNILLRHHPTASQIGTIRTEISHSKFTSQYLAISPAASVTLKSITLPPSLSQRKYVQAWSIIFSALSDKDRRNCALASRALRYAIYLSAIPILTRSYSGRRLAQITQIYPVSMTNFWPYLQQRRIQYETIENAYNASFLPCLLQGFNPISQRLWTSPDHERQIVIALRFILTKTWFALSVVGAKNSAWMKTIVTDTQEIVQNEIWSITVLSSTELSGTPEEQTFYVLESTCEVIGHPPAASSGSSSFIAKESSSISNLPLRVDWSEYVQSHLLSSTFRTSQPPPPPLLNHLKWTNGEEYDKGISKVWLSRVAKEGELGSMKKCIAERYVMACVVGNSVSGKWMTSTQMAQAFSGTSASACAIKPSRENPRVNLFLPAHHLIESLHFTDNSGRQLHSALAVVQTPTREYYILRDNGMEVGCEEDGVWTIWRKLLKCTEKGVDAGSNSHQ